MSKAQVVVLGAGRVGSLIARDLADAYAVAVVDRDEACLLALREAPIETRVRDVSDPDALREVVATANVVVDALPGHLGFAALRACLEAGKDVADIAFAPEDVLELDGLARSTGACALVDFGVAPGMSHVLFGREAAGLDAVERYACRVGGLPVHPAPPFDYKAPFSPIDVIEEYTRPARIRRDGREVVLPALSDVEALEVEGVGRLEAFLTDGLRSLLRRDDVPDMVEKTLRYPGHARLMEAFRAAGLFGTDPVEVGGVAVRPIDLVTALLFPCWAYGPGEADLTVMDVEIAGRGRDGAARRIRWRLLDRARDGASSMARTTGYPCAAAARLLLEGGWRRPGVHPPEVVGADDAAFGFLLDHQAARGVTYRREEI